MNAHLSYFSITLFQRISNVAHLGSEETYDLRNPRSRHHRKECLRPKSSLLAKCDDRLLQPRYSRKCYGPTCQTHISNCRFSNVCHCVHVHTYRVQGLAAQMVCLLAIRGTPIRIGGSQQERTDGKDSNELHVGQVCERELKNEGRSGWCLQPVMTAAASSSCWLVYVCCRS